MTADEFETFKKMAQHFTDTKGATPEATRATLIEEGIMTPDGDLAPEYGGPARKV